VTSRQVVLREVQPVSDGALMQAFYDEIMVEAFTPDELGKPYWDPEKDDPSIRTILALGPSEEILGGIVGEWFTKSEVLLIAWVAVRRDCRGQAIGTRLMGRAAADWYRLPGTRLVVGELDDPRHWPSKDQDPVARLRFYERFGVQALDVPYFQPSIGIGHKHVYHMLLASFDPQATAIDEGGVVGGALLRQFIEEYLVGSSHLSGREGVLDSDSEWLLSCYDRTVIPLVPLLDYERIESPHPPGSA
jgi:GNAT superfamily N-acetyltransferase